MQLNMCKHCHTIFYSRLKLRSCEKCRHQDEELFSRIEEYLKEFPNSNAMQIADGLKIQTQEVLAFVDEGRLMIAKGYFEKG